MGIRNSLLVAVLLGQCISPLFAVDFQVSAEARVEAGLDAETRKLIEGWPENLRKNIIQALVKALPLIDKSVSSYLEEVDAILFKLQADFVCHGIGTVKGSTEAAIAEAAKIFGKQHMARPTRNLDVVWKSLETNFSESDQPQAYILAYADFMTNAAITVCEVGENSAAAKTIEEMQQDAFLRWKTWRQAQSMDCNSAASCLDSALERVKEELSSADSQDVQAARANQEFNKVKVPGPPGLLSRFRQGPYEDGMVQLFKILDSIAVARLNREAAEQDLAGITTTLDNMNKEVAGANAKLVRGHFSGCNLVAKREADAVRKRLGDGTATLKKLQAIIKWSPYSTDRVLVQTFRMGELSSKSAHIIDVADVSQTVEPDGGIFVKPKRLRECGYR